MREGIDIINKAKNKLRSYASELLGHKKYLKIRHFLLLGSRLNLDNPRTYNEKVNKRKLICRDEKIIKCSDKYKVRDYVKDKVGGEYLIELIDARKQVNIEDIEDYPDQFVLKPNNRSGGVKIIKDKKSIRTKDILDVNTKVLQSYGQYRAEWWYDHIEPVILVERLLTNSKGNLPREFKVYCFNNGDRIKKVIRLVKDRDTDKKDAFFDEDWNRLNIRYNDNKKIKKEIDRPSRLDEVLWISEELSKNFDHVRVDLLEKKGKGLYFGEMTFADTSGFVKFNPQYWNRKLGKMWRLSCD
jgi:hypothetical protein